MQPNPFGRTFDSYSTTVLSTSMSRGLWLPQSFFAVQNPVQRLFVFKEVGGKSETGGKL
jgi:hypothetical protein